MRFVLLFLTFATAGVFGDERTFQFVHAETTKDFQEAAAVMKFILHPAEVTLDEPQRAVTLRGTPGDITLAAWLVEWLDGGMPEGGVQQIQFSGVDDVVEVLSLKNCDSLQSFQEAATAMRSVGEIRTLYTYNRPKLVAMRGTAGQADMARWLAGELIKANAGGTAPVTRRFENLHPTDDTVAVLYLKNSPSVLSFQKAATEIRSVTRIPRFFTYSGPRAFIVRGTAGQIATVEQMVEARN